MKAVRDGLVEDVVDERRLARPRHSRHAGQRAERNADVDSLQVVLARAADLDRAARRAPARRQLDSRRPGEELAGQRLGHALDLARGALGDDPAAVLAGARPKVDQVVGGAHRLLVVLDHEHRVAEVAQPLERRDELRVVALVQPDRGLVEHVEHADQRRPDLRRQPDPLGLATRQRGGGAVHREVADADVVEELEAFGDLAHDQPRDVALGVAQLDGREPGERGARGERAELVDRRPGDQHGERLRPQSRAVALRAWPHAHELLDLLAREFRVGLAVAALEVRDDPLKARRVGALASVAVAVAHLDRFAVGAVKEGPPLLLAQRAPGRLEVDPVALRKRRGHLVVVGRAARRPRRQRALPDRELRVGHHQLRIDLELRPQTGAARARALRRVEREHPRLELGHRGAALQAGELLREGERLAELAATRDDRHRDDPVGERGCCLDRIHQALAHVRAHDESVDHHRDVMLDLLFERELLLERAKLAVKQNPRETLRSQLLEQLPVLALAAAHDRREHHETRALGQLEHLVGDLLDRLPGDPRAADVAVRHADPRPQQAQVVVDLGDGPDGRARVARGRLLVDRDRRREPLDRIDVRLVHLPEELAGVGRKRLDVAALPLGVDRVERQRRLARAREPRQHDEGVARQAQRDVLQIVLAGPCDDDLIRGRHLRRIVPRRTDVRVRGEKNPRSPGRETTCQLLPSATTISTLSVHIGPQRGDHT